MKLKNKILFIALFFGIFLIFNNSNVKAGHVFDNPSNVIEDTSELSYETAKNICESSDSSKFPSDYSEQNYPYFFVRMSDEGEYCIYYSSSPIRVIATHYLPTKPSAILYPIVNDSENAKCFMVVYNKEHKFIYYNDIIDGYTGNKTVSYYSNHNISFCDISSLCDYGVETSYNHNHIKYSFPITSFFLAKCQISPFNTAVKTVQSQLVPTQIQGTLKTLIPVGLMVFSALLVIYIIRSKIWRPI